MKNKKFLSRRYFDFDSFRNASFSQTLRLAFIEHELQKCKMRQGQVFFIFALSILIITFYELNISSCVDANTKITERGKKAQLKLTIEYIEWSRAKTLLEKYFNRKITCLKIDTTKIKWLNILQARHKGRDFWLFAWHTYLVGLHEKLKDHWCARYEIKLIKAAACAFEIRSGGRQSAAKCLEKRNSSFCALLFALFLHSQQVNMN